MNITIDREMLQKLYYFSLKKTGKPHEAEELVQETAFEIIRMLNKGYKPDNFNAWIWTVIRKRYARWCKAKNIIASKYETDDVSDFTDLASDECIEDNVLQDEDIELLHREIALMTKDYREIVVLYYFDGKKIEAISAVTGLPEGTIKRKLYEARKNIKEGMKMAKTTGKRSYAPEEITFTYSVNNESPNRHPLGKPRKLLKSLAAQNIVLEAYNNPSSVEDLSLALGIASPYIEDELQELLETQVMVKNKDGKLETNFVIINAETNKRIVEILEEAGKKINPLICGIIEKNYDKIIGIGFINHKMPKEYLYWCLLYLTIEKLLHNINIEGGFRFTERSDGEKWDITAHEIFDTHGAYDSWCNRTSDGKTEDLFYDHYKVNIADIYAVDGDYAMLQDELYLLNDIIINHRSKSSFDAAENSVIDRFVKNHVISFSGDLIKVNFPVFNESGKHELSAYHDIVREIYEGEVKIELENVYNCIYKEISESLPVRFKDSHVISKEAVLSMFKFRCILLRYAFEKGIIKTPDGVDKSQVTMYMTF